MLGKCLQLLAAQRDAAHGVLQERLFRLPNFDMYLWVNGICVAGLRTNEAKRSADEDGSSHSRWPRAEE